MPPLLDEQIRRKVIQQWFNGFPRDTIAAENNIGAGTVTSIVSNYKVGLENSDLDSARNLAVEAKKHELTPSDLASYFRLYNFFRKSGASEEEVESFIANIKSNDIPPENVVHCVNQLYEILRGESISLKELPGYIEKKLEEKKKIDEEIQQADAILQSKNVTLEAVNEYLKLSEELDKHRLSTGDIHKLLNILINAKKYGFDGKEIAARLYNFKFLEWKEKELKDKRKKLSKRISKYKDVVPLTEEIAALQIGIDELIALKVAINEAAKHYNLPPLAATLRLIEDIKKYNKINRLNKELSSLYLQKYTLDQVCFRQNEALINLAKLKSYGLTDDRIVQLNNMLLENNGYKSNS
jgi:hypothetical protein